MFPEASGNSLALLTCTLVLMATSVGQKRSKAWPHALFRETSAETCTFSTITRIETEEVLAEEPAVNDEL